MGQVDLRNFEQDLLHRSILNFLGEQNNPTTPREAPKFNPNGNLRPLGLKSCAKKGHKQAPLSR